MRANASATADGRSTVSMGSAGTRAVNTTSFRALSIAFDAGVRLPKHHHAEANLVVTLSGRFERTSSHQRLVCSLGTVFTEPAGEPHSNDFRESAASVLILQPVSDLPVCTHAQRRVFDRPMIVENPRITRLGADVANEVHAPDAFTELAVDGLVLQMLALALRTETHSPVRGRTAWLERIVEYIRQRPTRRLTLPELAMLSDVHPSYLARMFRSTYGVSVARFARNVRLEEAGRHLATTARPIGAIALDAGFADQSHFTRAFAP